MHDDLFSTQRYPSRSQPGVPGKPQHAEHRHHHFPPHGIPAKQDRCTRYHSQQPATSSLTDRAERHPSRLTRLTSATRPNSAEHCGTLCYHHTARVTAAQQSSVASALNVSLGNVQCAANVDQQLNANLQRCTMLWLLHPRSLRTSWRTQARSPTTSTTQLQALNLSGAANVQCANVLAQNHFVQCRVWRYVLEANPSAANQATLTAQLKGQFPSLDSHALALTFRLVYSTTFNIDVTTLWMQLSPSESQGTFFYS
ncbi:hypothetical protein CYLTODRAFT_126565 [Cylindrobasidium torrendii FP15055 ss-10]|uniref:Uncharacterized protein n=1 Tax=Cylindrobasidium torrendii FP15055 ss-10 TaxID=1314674 RepID=A0A0D7AZG9_9AGAR|nr:hypothetical protein CYLTODRAFT_126565 [Cylindrobasidium torrendii FP15055 ss-10]